MIRFPSRATEKTHLPTRSMDSAQDTTTTNQSLKRSKSKAKLKQQHQADGSISSINRRRANSESSTPRRSQSKKEKINAVSKASLAMLDPRHAMGMDSEFGQHSYSSQDDEEEEERQRERDRQLEQYDGIWRENGKSNIEDPSINHAGRGVSKKNAASTLPKWSDQKIDPAWQMSPTPTLEAFVTGNNFDSDSPSPCSPSLGQVISSNHQPMILQEKESIESSPFEMDDKPQQFVSVFEDDQENNNTLQRQGTLSRVMLRSGSDQSSDSNSKHRTNKSSHKNGSSSSISFVEPNFNNKTKSRKSSFPNVPNNPSLPANSSSIARFFSWKRTNKDKNLPSPLVLNTTRNPLDHSEYPYGGASSAPPNVTTFEDAARKANINNNSGSAPANVTTFEEAEAKARTNGKDSNREMENFSSLFGHGNTSTSFAPTLEARPQWEALDMDQAFQSASQGVYGGEGFNDGQGQVGKRISTLGRKHSLPTMSEQDRASRLSIWIPPPTHSTANFNFGSPSSRNQSHSEEETNLNASPTKSPVVALPVLPAIPNCSNSPTLFATPAWEASLSRFMDEPSSPSSWSISTGTSGKSLSRVSTLGRGVPNRKSLFEPTEPMPTSKNGKQSSPTKETQRSPRRADSDPSEATKAKVLRRVSRSVGSFNAPPPPLSSFGSPPTFFSPNVPDVPTFLDGNMTSSPSMVSSPSLGFGRGRGNFQVSEKSSLGGGMGRGRGRGLWNGTPPQRSVSTFTPVVTHQQPLVHRENLSLGGEGLSTDLARNLSITSTNSGTSKLGHSPSDSTDSMASITASSEVHLSTQQARRVNLQQAGRAVPVGVASPSLVRSPRTALTKTLASDLVVTVMPPTPDLRIASSPQDQFPGRNQGQEDEDEEECLDDAYGEGMTSEVAQDIERSFSPISSPVKENKSPMRSPGSWRRRDTVIIDGPENIRSPLGLQLEMQSVSGVLPLIQDQGAELYSLPYMEAKGDANDAGLGLDLGMEAIMRRRVDSHSSLRSDASASTGSGEPFGFSRSLSSMSLASDASSLGGSASSGTFSNVGSSTTDLTSPAKSFKSESSYRRDIGNEDNSEDLPPLVPMLKFGSDKSIHEKASSQNASPTAANRETSPSAPSNNFLGVGLPSRAHNLSTSSISSALSGITASTSILNLEEDQELEAEKFAKEQGLFSHRSRLQQDSQAQQGPLRTAFPFNKFAVQSPISNNNQELNEDDCETPKIGSGSDTSSPFSQPRTSPIEETESELRSAIAELPATWLANPQSQSSPALRKAAPPKPPKSRARSNSIYQNPSINLQVEVSSGIEAVSPPVSRALRPLALVQQAQGKKDEIIETTRPLFIKRPQPRIVNHNVNRGKENNDPSLVKRRSTHYVNQLASPLSTSTSSRFANNYNSPSSSPRIGGMKSTTSTPSPPLSGLGIGLGFDFGGNAQNDQVQRSPSWRSDGSNEWMGVAM